MNRFRPYLVKMSNMVENTYDNVLTVPFRRYKNTFAIPLSNFWFRPFYLQEFYMVLGLWEPYVRRELKNLLHPDSVFIDIGAYIGSHTVFAAKIAGRVIAFEPDGRTYKILERNCRSLKNVNLHHEAVGSKMADIYLKHHPIPSYNETTDIEGKDCEPVRCVTLDSLLPQVDGPPVVKIDVEGKEVEVLKGGLNFIAQKQPDIIVETGTPEAIAELLQDYDGHCLFSPYWVYTKKNKSAK